MKAYLVLAASLQRRVPSLLGAVILGLLLPACAAPGFRLTHVQLQPLSYGTVDISSIRAYAAPEGGIFVTGSVRKHLGSLPRPSHLEIEALDSEGRTLAQVVTFYTPNPLRNARPGVRSQGIYRAHVPVKPEAIRTIRVTHRPTLPKGTEQAH